MGVYKYPQLDKSLYKVPTILDESNAREFVALRDEYALLLGRKIKDLLTMVADELLVLAYKYDINAKDFSFDLFETLQTRVEEIMEEAEEDIVEMLEEYATKIADNNGDKVALLLAFLMTLGNKGRSMRETLRMYMNRFRSDIEAVIAAFKYAKVEQMTAVTQMNTHLTNIQNIPAVQMVRKEPLGFSAQLIQDGFIHYDPATHTRTSGVPTSGILAVIQMVTMASQFTWQHWQLLNFADRGAVGYYQMRNPASHFDCAVCDSEVGFHLGTIDEPYNTHARCKCLRIPIFMK